MIQFSVFDKDIITADDFGGEAFYPLSAVPGNIIYFPMFLSRQRYNTDYKYFVLESRIFFENKLQALQVLMHLLVIITDLRRYICRLHFSKIRVSKIVFQLLGHTSYCRISNLIYVRAKGPNKCICMLNLFEI